MLSWFCLLFTSGLVLSWFCLLLIVRTNVQMVLLADGSACFSHEDWSWSSFWFCLLLSVRTYPRLVLPASQRRDSVGAAVSHRQCWFSVGSACFLQTAPVPCFFFLLPTVRTDPWMVLFAFHCADWSSVVMLASIRSGIRTDPLFLLPTSLGICVLLLHCYLLRTDGTAPRFILSAYSLLVCAWFVLLPTSYTDTQLTLSDFIGCINFQLALSDSHSLHWSSLGSACFAQSTYTDPQLILSDLTVQYLLIVVS